jgi:ribonuclease BN (tRNA processing enzyme)
MIKITFLGTGTAWPRLERFPSSLLININEKNILIDIGSGIIHQLLKTKKDLNDIDYLFITHLHPDHTSELISLLFSVRKRLGFNKERPILMIGGKNIKKFYKKLRKPFGHWADAGNKLIIKELVNKKANLSGIKVETLQVPHNKESIAFKIEFKDKKIVYSGDTDFSQGLIKFSKESDVLILECSQPDKTRKKGHLSPTLVAQIAKEANAKKLVLTHFYPEIEKENIAQIVKRTYKGKIILAKDLMEILI